MSAARPPGPSRATRIRPRQQLCPQDPSSVSVEPKSHPLLISGRIETCNTLANRLWWNWRWSFQRLLIEIQPVLGKRNSTMSPQLSGNIIECKWKDLWYFSFMNLLLSLQEWRTSIFHGLSPGLCILAGARHVALILAGFLWLPGGFGPSAWWGQGPFHLSSLISRFPSLNGSCAFSLLGPPFWDGKLCYSSVVLSWTCCGNPLCLSCDCHPALHLRRGTCFYSLCFCSFVKVQLTWSLLSSVSDHFCYFPFPFSLLLLSISVLVTRLRHTHACCWSVYYALRAALISFHSLNSGISSWHIWDLNEQCLVF